MLKRTIRTILIYFAAFSVILFLVLFALKKSNVHLSTSNTIQFLGYYFVACTFLMLFIQLIFNYNFDKRKSAINFLYERQWAILKISAEELNKLLGKRYAVFEQNESLINELVKSKHDEPTKFKIEKQAIEILNFYEIMAVAIHQGVLDNEVCFDFLSAMTIPFYDWTRTYIDERSKKLEDERLFNNFELLMLEWKEILRQGRKRDMATRLRLLQRRFQKRTLVDSH